MGLPSQLPVSVSSLKKSKLNIVHLQVKDESETVKKFGIFYVFSGIKKHCEGFPVTPEEMAQFKRVSFDFLKQIIDELEIKKESFSFLEIKLLAEKIQLDIWETFTWEQVIINE
mgnify:CR=1 FL=1